MDMQKTFLVAVEPEGPRADDVIRRAIDLALLCNASLTLLHVVPEGLMQAADELQSASRGAVEDHLLQNAGRAVDALVASYPDIAIDVRITPGAPAFAIADVAGTLSADLIIMGVNEQSPLRARIMGSTTERVIQMAVAPVLVVKRAGTERYRRILAAVDFSPGSEAAAAVAATLGDDITLSLVHVLHVPIQFEQALITSGAGQRGIDTFHKSRKTTAEKRLAALATRITSAASGIDTSVLTGEPVSTLVKLSRSLNTELMSLGAEQRHPLMRVLLGSVASHLLNEATCDLLIDCAPTAPDNAA
ncbi:MAG: universal stress protein [Chromatocurvus sp.]